MYLTRPAFGGKVLLYRKSFIQRLRFKSDGADGVGPQAKKTLRKEMQNIWRIFQDMKIPSSYSSMNFLTQYKLLT